MSNDNVSTIGIQENKVSHLGTGLHFTPFVNTSSHLALVKIQVFDLGNVRLSARVQLQCQQQTLAYSTPLQ